MWRNSGVNENDIHSFVTKRSPKAGDPELVWSFLVSEAPHLSSITFGFKVDLPTPRMYSESSQQRKRAEKGAPSFKKTT
jgi:hypothetical protein